MGVELMDEATYRRLQDLMELDTKTSSWVLTPEDVRGLGGALFCERRYGRTFTFHNGADSYYGVASCACDREPTCQCNGGQPNGLPPSTFW